MNLIKLEIIVIQLANKEKQLITPVISMLFGIKVILYHLSFTILATMIVIYFFKKLVDKKKDKVEIKIIPKANEEYFSVRHGCVRFKDSYMFLSSNLDKLVKTLVDNSHKTMKNLKEETVDNGEILNIVNEIRIIIKEDTFENDSIKDLKKDCPNKNEKFEGALLNYMGENDRKTLTTEFPDNTWKYLTEKLA